MLRIQTFMDTAIRNIEFGGIASSEFDFVPALKLEWVTDTVGRGRRPRAALATLRLGGGTMGSEAGLALCAAEVAKTIAEVSDALRAQWIHLATAAGAIDGDRVRAGRTAPGHPRSFRH